jgi:hypothetical protein
MNYEPFSWRREYGRADHVPGVGKTMIPKQISGTSELFGISEELEFH